MAASQIKKKFIGDNQVDGSKILLGSAQTLRKEDGLGGEIDVIADIEGQIAAEEARALAAEGVLASDIADVNTRVDNVLSNVDGTALNSLSEIVTAFQAADDDLNGAITLLASDLDTRIDGVDATVSAIDARLITAEGEIDTLQAGLAQEILDRAADVDAEEARALAAESALDGAKVSKTGDTMSGFLRTEDNVEPQNFTQVEFGSITLSSVDVGSGDNLSGTFNGGSIVLEKENAGVIYHAEVNFDSMILTYDDGINGPVPAMPTLPEMLTTKAYVDQEISALSAGGVAALQSELDATQAGAGLEASGAYVAVVGSNFLDMAVSLKDADNLLDAQIQLAKDDIAQEILDRAADVDAEEARALAAEGVLDGKIDAEEARALAAEGLLDGRIDALEAVIWYDEKFTVNAGILAAGSVTLAHTPKAKSVIAFVDRLGIFEGAAEDFTMAGAVMTFVNALVSPGNQALQSGDEIRVKYQA